MDLPIGEVDRQQEPYQVVRLNAEGRPLPGIAVTRAKERLATANMAQVAPGAQTRKRPSRGKIR